MNKHAARLIIVVALPCEARPLIDRYQLKKDVASRIFTIYHHKNLPVSVLVSGVGKIKMAAAIAYAHQYLGLAGQSYYVNVGIAGSTALPVGDIIIADKIIDHATGRAYFPFIYSEKSMVLTQVVSHDIPVIDYPVTGVVDMEASAFFATTTLFVTQEQVAVIKIISDANVRQQTGLNPEQVIKLISAQLISIDERIKALLSVMSGVVGVADEERDRVFCCLTQRWHFTTCQQQQLRQLLRRWRILLPQQHPLPMCVVNSSAKQVLATMESHLAGIDYQW